MIYNYEFTPVAFQCSAVCVRRGGGRSSPRGSPDSNDENMACVHLK